jgi:two-component system chemotaxis sensor kinase CheA
VTVGQGPFFEQFIEDYYAECDEHLGTMRRALLEIEESRYGAIDPARIGEIRRSLHTLKGLSAMVGLGSAEQVAHILEDVLRTAGPSPSRLEPPLIETLFEGARLLEECVAARRSGALAPSLAELLEHAAAFTIKTDDDGFGASTALVVSDAGKGEPASPLGSAVFRFEFSPSADTSARGVGVETVRERLLSIGDILAASPRVDERGAITFDFRVAVHAGEAPNEQWREDRLAWEREDNALSAPVAGAGAVVAFTPATPAASVLRVDLGRLEDLMRTVGELVVSRSRLGETLRRGGAASDGALWEELQETNTSLERQLRALRDGVMRIRLVRIGELFERLRFVIRDIAREAQKEVIVEMSGQDTEVDKAVVDRMLEPLMHIVRNAVSHGIERPDVRRERGKERAGRLTLRASASGDRIMLTVEDDGGGVDEQAILSRAVSLGAVAGPRDAQAHGLLDILCLPGFSTRAEADLSSGRGVGMAVGRSAIRELGGELSMVTELGRGTGFRIELPLTLMIVDALLIELAGQQMAVPQPVLREIIQVDASEISSFENNAIISYRSRVLPLISLRSLFGFPRVQAASLYVLVVGNDAQLAGLVVDRICGLREIVVKPINDPLLAVPGVSGATELGDGRVSLILDASALVRLAHRRAPTRRPELHTLAAS